MKEKIIIYGAGGHAKVVIDVILNQRKYNVAGVIDDNPELTGISVLGYPVLGGSELLRELNQDSIFKAIAGIGDNRTRWAAIRKLRDAHFQLATTVHPDASIGREVTIGAGTVIMAKAVVNPGSVIGENVIINTSSSVDHDCCIGDYAHICPGVNLAGGVSIGDVSLIGIGSAVLPSVSIGSNVVIGAGSVIIDDVCDNMTMVGVPAHSIAL